MNPAVRLGAACLSLLIAAHLGARDGVSWTRLSSDRGELPVPGSGIQQTSCVVADVDGDGDEDFFYTERSEAPAIELYLRGAAGWTTQVIEPERLVIEAGGAAHDIDGDGDLDVAFAQDRSGGTVWWWENPWPDLDSGAPWTRRVIKTTGEQGHDQTFGDFDGDGRVEFATWVNTSHRLEIYEIPSDPRSAGLWPLAATLEMRGEGIAAVDVDQDGVVDLLAGGHWIRHEGGTTYEAYPIDTTYLHSRIVGAQFEPGGYIEVLMNSGDRDGPLRYYRHDGDGWVAREVIPWVIHGHTLEVADIDADGHFDFFAAEMGDPGAGSDATAWIGWGDGAGGFDVEVLSVGIGNHMSRIADLDGDGDADLLVKPFKYGAPRVDVFLQNGTSSGLLRLDRWERHLVDGSLPDRAVLVEAGDLDGDGLLDVAAGAWWWSNPGSLGSVWTRRVVGEHFGNVALVADLDRDGKLDLFGTEGVGATADHRLVWARGNGAGGFTVHRGLPTGGSGDFLQGRALLEPGDGTYRIVLSWHNGGGGVHELTVPTAPLTQPWSFRTISTLTEREDLSPGDIDGDGRTDLLLGTRWLEQQAGGDWVVRTLGIVSDLPASSPPTAPQPDRHELVDVDGDGDLDAVVALEGGASVVWFENPRPGGDVTGSWTRRLLGSVAGQGFSLDSQDLDGDGDPDVVVGEHQGSPDNRVVILENDGTRTSWPVVLVDRQAATVVDHHDGTRLHDLDQDGDLDIVSVGWNRRKLWVYENTSPAAGTGRVVAPAASPRGGEFAGAVTVSLSTPTPGATIRYTTDGSDPEASSARYSTPLVLQTTTTLRARAFRAGWTTSAAVTERYTILADSTPPQVTSVTAFREPTQVTVGFSEPVDAASAAVASHWEIAPGVEVLAALVQPGGRAVLLSVDGLSVGVAYELSVDGVTDLATPPNEVAADTSVPFRYEPRRLVAHWGFDEGSGGEAADGSGQNHVGLIRGAVWNEGLAGAALRFDGQDDRVEVASFDVTGSELTLAAWIRADRFDHLSHRDARILSRANGTAEDSHLWMLSGVDDGGTTRLRVRIKANGSTTTHVASGSVLSPGQWTHVAAVYDGAEIRVYQDARLVGRQAKTGPLATAAEVPIWIGGNPPRATDRPFDGLIDDVRIYSAALSQSEMEDLVRVVDPREKVAAPVATPDPRPFRRSIDVELATATEQAEIRYTLDGSAPDESSSLYLGPIELTETTTVRARAYRDGWHASEILEAFYERDDAGVGLDDVLVDPYGGGDFEDIASAIDAVEDGALVRVAPGEYRLTSPVDFNRRWRDGDPEHPERRAIRLVAEQGPDRTMLELGPDAAGAGDLPVIRFSSGEDVGSLVEGFTVRGGPSGGIRVEAGSSPLIRNCWILECDGQSGGGIDCRGGAAPRLESCRIEACRASLGGAVSAREGATPRLVDCEIRGNVATGCGSAAYVDGGAFARFERCRILGNSEDEDCGVLTVEGISYLRLESCVVAGNRGGAVLSRRTADLWVVQSTIAQNSGAAIVCDGAGVVEASGCVAWDNGAGLGCAVVEASLVDSDPAFVTEGVYRFDRYASRGVGGSSVSMPDFVVVEPDYRLRPESPAIDSGGFEGAPTIDLDGAARPCGDGYDSGAYEAGGCAAPVVPFRRGDVNTDARLDISDGIFLLEYLFFGRSLGCLDAGDANDDANLDISDPIWVLSYLFQGGAAPVAPYPDCGVDPSDDALGCVEKPTCD